MTRPLSAGLTALLVLAGSSAWAQGTGAPIERILLESTLWGRDQPLLLAQLALFRELGESSVYVFHDRAAGANALATARAAQVSIDKVRPAAARPARLRPQFLELERKATATGRSPLRLQAAKLIDDDGYHVVLDRGDAVELLPPGLTMAQVRQRLGEAERVTHRTIQNQTERKPVILTLHVYAGGAIAFAESNVTEPGIVERVVLDLPAVLAVVAP